MTDQDRLDAPLYHEITIPLTEWERVVAGALDIRASIAYLLATRGLDGPVHDDWSGWERGYRAALDEVRAALHREDGA